MISPGFQRSMEGMTMSDTKKLECLVHYESFEHITYKANKNNFY